MFFQKKNKSNELKRFLMLNYYKGFSIYGRTNVGLANCFQKKGCQSGSLIINRNLIK